MKPLTGLLMVFAILVPFAGAGAGELPAMTVWKRPWCGCCGKWVEHMRQAGFKVDVKSAEDLDKIKSSAGVPERLQACHTAKVAGYTIEGHVPAADVMKLLKSKLKVLGLAVPGMPSGSPGMENGRYDPYDVVTFAKDGKTTVFNSYK